MPRVLIVDDEALIHDVVGTILDLEEFDVVSATSADAAWDLLTRDPPDLVVSDVMMPERDGLSLCRQIRDDERFAGLPVVLLTARDESADRVAAKEAGADAYLTKPFSPLVLIDTIQNLLGGGA